MPSVMELIVRARDQATKVLHGVGDATETVATKARSASQKMVDVGDNMQQAGKKATLFASVPVVAGLLKMTQDAEGLNESVNAVNQVFGDAADKLHEFGKTSANTVGLSAAAFNELVTPVGAMLRNAGLGADEAADASINLSQRASDMASVFNTDVSEALGAIQAGLRGEADPLERFGVGLSAAAVKAHALTSGLVEATVDTDALAAAQVKHEKAQKAVTAAIEEHGEESLEAREAKVKLTEAEGKLEEAMAGQTTEMTSAQQAQARLSLLMKQTERIAGDFAATSEESANAQRIAAARAEDLSAKFGQKLIPLKTKAIEVANRLLDRFEKMSPTMQTAALAVAGVVAAAGPLLFILGSVIKMLGHLGKGVGKAVSAVSGLSKAFRGADDAPKWANRIASASKKVGRGVGRAARATARGTATAVKALGRWIAAGARWAAQQAVAAGKALATMAVTAAKFVAHYARMAAQALANAARMAVSWVIAMGPVGWVIAGIVALVALIIANWDKVVRFTRKMAERVAGWFRRVRDRVVNTARNLRDRVVGFITDLRDRAIAIVVALVRGYISYLLWWRDRILGVVTWVRDKFVAGVTFLRDRALALVQGLADGIRSRFDRIISFVTGLPGRIASAASGMWDGITDAFRSAINRVIRWWNGLSLTLAVPSNVITRAIGIAGDGFSISTPNIPTLHRGGQFRSRQPGGEGLALLRDRERVRTPEQEDRLEQLLTRILRTLESQQGRGITIGEGASLIGELKAWTDHFRLNDVFEDLAMQGAG